MTFGDDERRTANVDNADFRPFVCLDDQALNDDVLQPDTDMPLGKGFTSTACPPA